VCYGDDDVLPWTITKWQGTLMKDYDDPISVYGGSFPEPQTERNIHIATSQPVRVIHQQYAPGTLSFCSPSTIQRQQLAQLKSVENRKNANAIRLRRPTGCKGAPDCDRIAARAKFCRK
jgi:hypothetical protein